MKRVFICSPFSGDVERNVQYAKVGCRSAVIMGYAPIAPHLFYPQFLMDEIPSDRKRGIDCGLAFLSVCNELWVMDKYGISAGMKKEIAYARRNGVPVIRYYVRR